MVFLSTGSKWGPICHGLMMKFLARTQPTPPSTSHSFPEALYRSLFIILRNSPWRRLSHPLLGLCEREAEPGFRNFQWKPVAGLSQGAISGWTACSSWPESGQFGQGMWVNGRIQERVVLLGSLASPLFNTEPSRNIEFLNVNGQSCSRILSYFIVTLAVESSSLFIF